MAQQTDSEAKSLSDASDNAVDRMALQWALGPDTGASSMCMAARLCGLASRDDSHPHDPDDLGRCLRLLDLIPALRARLPIMRDVNDYWAALIDRWDEIESSMANECGIRWEKARSAPKTYALMRSILDPVEREDRNIVRFGSGAVIRSLPLEENE